MLFIVTVILVLLVALKMPRKRTRHELLATIQFALLMNFVTDMYLDLRYKLYWYFDKEQIEWLYLIVALGEVAVLLIIFNYFPLRSNTIKKFLYILGWTCILVLLELYAVYIRVLHYGEWKIIYSAGVYFISMCILYFVLDYTADKRET
ncbi:CBO0543 family protein [Salirhabdus sp. Marseille-P4669]|uniref:CBO0543 family protein n=1 Tax=Salirhabdus sp. Marseille-P4669 TaxID=2042310 RepID=UPI000C7B854E